MPDEPERRRPRLALVLALALAAPIAIALLVVEPLGLQDLPQHVAIARLGVTSVSELPPDVEPVAVPLWHPYRGLYSVLGSFGPGHVLGVARALLALYVLGTALAVLRLATLLETEERGDPRLATVGGPLAASLMLWSGFLGFLLAVPILVAFVAELVLIAERRQEGRLTGPVGRAVACLAALHVLHPLVLSLAAALGVAAALLAFLRDRPRGGRAALVVTPALSGVALAAVSLGLTVSLSRRAEGGLVGQIVGQLSFDEVVRRVEVLGRNTWIHYGWPSTRATVASLATALVGLGLALGVGVPRGRNVLVLVAAFVACGGATLVLPHRVGDLGYAGVRFGLPALLFLVALLAGPLATRRFARAAVPLVVAGGAALSLGSCEALVAVGRELAPVARVARRLAAEPRPPRVLPFCLDGRTRVITTGFDVAVSAHDWVNVATGGSNPYLFDNPFLPIRPTAQRIVGPGIFSPLEYEPGRHGRGATHYLVRLRSRREPDPAVAALLERIAQTHDLAVQDEDWLLFVARP